MIDVEVCNPLTVFADCWLGAARCEDMVVSLERHCPEAWLNNGLSCPNQDPGGGFLFQLPPSFTPGPWHSSLPDSIDIPIRTLWKLHQLPSSLPLGPWVLYQLSLTFPLEPKWALQTPCLGFLGVLCFFRSNIWSEVHPLSWPQEIWASFRIVLPIWICAVRSSHFFCLLDLGVLCLYLNNSWKLCIHYRHFPSSGYNSLWTL